ncbi:MAG: sugar phosphate nucleotidyltransferase [Nanoarchaeota archaeon]
MKERITITLDQGLIKQIDKRKTGAGEENRSSKIEKILGDALGISIPTKAFVLVGGKGTRLSPLTDNMPKALVKIGGKTITEWLFDLFKKYGIREVVLSVGHMSDKIKEYFEDGGRFGVNIEYVTEDKPLGTAGPIKLAEKMLDDSFIVSNGDELKCINIPRMYRLHKRKKALATIALTTVQNPALYGVARLDGSRIIEFVEKPNQKDAKSNLINSGFYILEPEVIEMIPKNKYCMLEKDVFPKLAKEGRLRGFPFSGQWFDIGSMERLDKARKMWKGVNVLESD